MNVKQMLIGGVAALAVGLVLLAVLFEPVKIVVGGAVTIIVLLLGIMFIWMGVIQVSEDRANERKEAEEAERAKAMAAGESS